MVVKKTADPDAQMLALIDAGAEDMEDVGAEFEVYVAPDKLGQVHKKLTEMGFEVSESELQMKPINFQTITDPAIAAKVMKFIDDMESHDDVQNVFTNADIPDEVMKNV
jgi:transcriptional/translational regulatory protein YebC/TACO1